MTAPSLFSDSGNPETSATEPLETEPMAAAASVAAASLYRKYRPQSFDAAELVGQEHVVRTLRNAIALDRVAHAYLFSGPRGTGKTTTARLLAKAINCLDPDPSRRPCNACASCLAINAGATPDLIEIDAASNRGIDDIRDLRERVRYAPAQLRSKVYIIDEAHQITGAAANAFLKTLEEPPAHTRFILATTDPEELLPTIVSRCQRFEFRRVGVDAMAARLRVVADREAIAIGDEALRAIARHATGSLRDALGILEQLSLLTPPAGDGLAVIDVAAVQAALGLSRNDRVERLVEAVAERNASAALHLVQDAVDAGEDPRQLNRQLLSYLRLLLIERSGGAAEADEPARALAARFSLADLAAHARRFGEIDFSIKHSPYPQLPLEIALVEAAAPEPSAPERPARTPESDLSGAAAPTVELPQPTTFRDRVRATPAPRGTLNRDPRPMNHPQPAPITPLRPVTVDTSTGDAPRADSAMSEVEQIAALWPNVRADVKAVNRRIEALLSEVDPVAVSGNQITLAVPYPFHRDKLNSDDVRETVAAALSRLLGREVSLVCVLRGEVSGAVAESTPPGEEPAREGAAGDAQPDDEVERARMRIRAAINIFDAEEIDSVAATDVSAAESSSNSPTPQE